jgi:hypothetical protein
MSSLIDWYNNHQSNKVLGALSVITTLHGVLLPPNISFGRATIILWIALFYLMNLTFGFLKDILSNKCNDTDVCIHVCTDLYQYMLCYSIGNVWNMTVVMIDSCDCGHCRRPQVQ